MSSCPILISEETTDHTIEPKFTVFGFREENILTSDSAPVKQDITFSVNSLD